MMTDRIEERKTGDRGQTEDMELLRRFARAGDETAFAELVRRHVSLVYRAALRQLAGDVHRAQDATQVVFTVLARKAAALARHPSLTGWLYTTTHFTVSDLRRHERRRTAREQEAHMIHEISRDPAAGADWDRLRPVLDDVMQQLSERDRVALLARFFEGRTFGEVGARLALSEDAARMRVERALEKLRALLGRRGVTSTTVALGLMMANEAAAATPAGLAVSVTGSALAGASAVVSPLAGIIQFMTTTKTVTAAAGVALVFCATVATREAGAYRAAQEARMGAVVREDALAKTVQAARRRADLLEEEILAAGRDLGAARAARKSPPAPKSPGPEATAVDLSDAERNELGRTFLKGSAAAREILAENTRLRTNNRYLPLFRELALGPEEIAEMRAILGRLGGMNFGNAAGLSINFPATLDDPLTRPEVETRLRATLGEDDYRRYQDYERILGARQITEQVGTLVYATETPLTAAQARQLEHVLAENSPAYHAGRGFSASGLEWTAAIQAARGFLAEPQIAALVGARDQLQYQNASDQAQREALQRWIASQPPQPPRH